MTNIDGLKVSRLADEAEDSYDSLDSIHENLNSIYENCFNETFEINNRNVRKIKKFEQECNDLFNLLCQISNYLTHEDDIQVTEKLSIRDGSIYKNGHLNRNASSFIFFSTPEIKDIVRENCSSEELADRFAESYNLSRYFCNTLSKTPNYINGVRVTEVPDSRAYGNVEENKNYYLVYRASHSAKDKITFRTFWKDSFYEALNDSDWSHRINRDSEKNREKFLRQIWHSKPIGVAVRDFNQNINVTYSAASDVKQKILNDFSEVLIANEV